MMERNEAGRAALWEAIATVAADMAEVRQRAEAARWQILGLFAEAEGAQAVKDAQIQKGQSDV